MSRSIVILGGGVAGLSAGWKLSEKGYKVDIIEKELTIGGMSASFRYKDCLLDYGPHKIYTQLDGIMEEIKDLLGDDLLEIPKKSRIRLKDKYFKYPVNTREILFGLHPILGLHLGFSYLYATMKNKIGKREDDSYESYIINRFGGGIYSLVFGPYARKIWGEPRELAASLAKSRVAIPSIADLIIRMFLGDKNKAEISASHFYYPKGGVIEISNKIAARVTGNDGQIHLNSIPVKIDYEKNDVIISGNGEEKKLKFSHLISTIPISNLIEIMNPKVPSIINKATESLKHMDLILLYIVLRKRRVFEDNFIFFPEEEFIFNRLSEQKGFSKYMVPEDKTVLCVEITCKHGDVIWNSSDELLYQRTLEDLIKAGLVKSEREVDEFFVSKLSNTYPIYDRDYKQNLNQILDYLDAIGNILPIGRQGIFNYCGMADAMDMGFNVARHIISEGTIIGWKETRRRFENYVTVD